MSEQNVYKRPLVVFLIYVAVSILMRICTYYPSVINHDESTYIVISSALLDGGFYWVDMIDTKPIGIFLVFAAIQAVFGKTILAIRLVTSLIIAFTSFFIYRTHQKIGGDHRASFVSGLIFMILISFFTFFGLSPNTEHFFVFFTILALSLIWQQTRYWTLFAAGILLGFGFTIKPVVLFDMIPFGLLVLVQNRSNIKTAITKTTTLALGTVIPFTIVALVYFLNGEFQAFFFYTFEVSGNYMINQPFSKTVSFIADFFLRFLPVTIWFFTSLISSQFIKKETRVFFLVWGLFVWAAILLPGKLFSHYTIQFMLPFCLLAGSFFDRRIVHGKFWTTILRPRVGYTLLIPLILTTLLIQKKEFIDVPDVPRLVANYLKPKIQEGGLVYTGDAPQIIYYLINQQSPIPYVHRSLLWDPSNAHALRINPQSIRSRLEADPAVGFYLFENLEPARPDPSIFELDSTIQNVLIYRRR